MRRVKRVGLANVCRLLLLLIPPPVNEEAGDGDRYRRDDGLSYFDTDRTNDVERERRSLPPPYRRGDSDDDRDRARLTL